MLTGWMAVFWLSHWVQEAQRLELCDLCRVGMELGLDVWVLGFIGLWALVEQE